MNLTPTSTNHKYTCSASSTIVSSKRSPYKRDDLASNSNHKIRIPTLYTITPKIDLISGMTLHPWISQVGCTHCIRCSKYSASYFALAWRKMRSDDHGFSRATNNKGGALCQEDIILALCARAHKAPCFCCWLLHHMPFRTKHIVSLAASQSKEIHPL